MVIGLDRGRISLSMKQLEKDPWQDSVKKYSIGQVVKGKVAKVMPYGVFVELDDQIQGLAHLMELSHNEVKNPADLLKVGEVRDFKIVSIEPKDHRLGLSIKQLQDKPAAKPTEEVKAAEEAKVEEPKAEEKKEEAK